MALTLTLLDDVRWRGERVAGERARALLAALALAGGATVRPERLVEAVWEEPATEAAAKRLQVLISRIRAAHGSEVIESAGGGYRLGIEAAEVDCLALAALARSAAAKLADDAAAAAELAGQAISLTSGLTPNPGDPETLRQLREAAAVDLHTARTVLAQANSRQGNHAEALNELELLAEIDTGATTAATDESLLADLLRSEAAVRGPAAALARYDTYRQALRDELGTNPGANLQKVHRELLALDAPVRSGIQYASTALLGRDDDVAQLRGLLGAARVVSIVGAGGLGKTRLAHVLAQDPSLPVARVVELVGVSDGDDVVGEVGSALGVRDSLTSRRTLTAAERADLRSRIAQHLGQGPSLLVLDNCEHLIGAVARLVAFLVSSTPELRVLTTSRAPLAIAAERVYLLGALPQQDAITLFTDRATAARPGVELPTEQVQSIVTRLDGLPLAIELAAARTRVMSVAEINRRLSDRFALLRGGDRSAPDRHQTLLAVIDWSWNLLDAAQQRALGWLSLWSDGFTLTTAEQVLGTDGTDALDCVQGLTDQSLLSVSETPRGLRYRMLETVREFGRARLALAGETDAARAARREWAVSLSQQEVPRMFGLEQVDAVELLAAEEVNLADELRVAITTRDHHTLMHLLAVLGWLWSIRGEHGRMMALLDAIVDALAGWEPDPRYYAMTRMALVITYTNLVFLGGDQIDEIGGLLASIPATDADPPILSATVKVTLAFDTRHQSESIQRLTALTGSEDPHVATLAWQWLSHLRENSGDHAGATHAAERALALIGPDQGPWRAANLQFQIVQLRLQSGDRSGAREYAREALAVMQRLGATDDLVQLRLLLALAAIGDGHPDEAEIELRLAAEVPRPSIEPISQALLHGAWAELSLARGEIENGLRRYREYAAVLRDFRLPGAPWDRPGPWTLFGEACALAAFAACVRTIGREIEDGTALLHSTAARTHEALDQPLASLDVPILGSSLLAIAAWLLAHQPADPAAEPSADPARLVVLAQKFSCNQLMPAMRWAPIAELLEAQRPGELAAATALYADREASDLLPETRAVLAPLVLNAAPPAQQV